MSRNGESQTIIEAEFCAIKNKNTSIDALGFFSVNVNASYELEFN